ncbi:hypothetical protein ACRRTK_020708 [Alexandromys fortis]
MSETGEMSEFGYIMELLAKGKVSNSAGGCVWGPGLGTPSMRVSCGIRPVRSWGDTDWDPGLRCARAHRSCTQCTVAAFSLCRRKGSPRASWRQWCQSPAGEKGDFRAARQHGDLEPVTGVGCRKRVRRSLSSRPG